MKKHVRIFTILFAAIVFGPLTWPGQVSAADRKTYTIAVSIYAGWMPWYYAKEFGIIDKWAKEKGIHITVVPMDYGPSIEAYSTGKADAVLITDMDVLMQPATSGVDSTVVIIGDYSNGNDALLVRGSKYKSISALKGHTVNLVTGTVSEYVLARALEMNNIDAANITVGHMEDSSIEGAFSAKATDAVVTWAPITLGIEQQPGVVRLFDSSRIPGEILDLCVVNTKVLKSQPKLGQALVGAWYEVLGLMGRRGAEGDSVLAGMAKQANCNLADYKAQLKTTAMFWKPEDAVAYASGPEIKQKMDLVRGFCFKKGFLGKDATSADVFGIQYPDNSVAGDKGNVRLRYVKTYMEGAGK